MTDSIRSRKKLWNRSSINGVVLAGILVLVCLSHVNPFEHDKDNAVDCSKLHTCQKCAEKTSCSWSLKRQTCVNTTQSPEHLVVNIRAHCPQFSIVDSFIHKMYLPFTYKVKVSNDVSGFVKYLRNTNITCMLKGGLYNGSVDPLTDTINCASMDSNKLDFYKQRLVIYHYTIMFNNVTLRLDDGLNNYFTVYNSYYCDIINKTKNCVSCFWDSEHYTYYYKRCSVGNACTGLFEFYDRLNLDIAVGTSANQTSSVDNGDYIAVDRISGTNNVTTTLNEFGPPANACPEMRIQLVEPSSAPWSGGTPLVITIRNHNVLAESQLVTVTVAERDCVHPKTLNDNTFECTIGPQKPNGLTTGPVHVMYGSILVLTSAQTFRFVYPEPTAMSPTCGPVTGGTLLRITGRSLDASSTVTVTVGPANVTCELVARYEDRILCVTGPSDGPVAGDVTVEFDKSLRLSVGPASNTITPSFEPVQFVYAGDPMLDAGQPFAGIASGGTYVPVRGRHFACVKNATLYVDDLDGMRHNANCGVLNDTFMVCRSPTLDVPRSSTERVSLNFGFRVHFADHMLDLFPQPDYPSYRLYADPIFVNFETDGRNITINGRHMDQGYRPSVDLVIRLRNAKGDLCVIRDTQRQRIVCNRLAVGKGDDLRELYVTVGHEFVHIVKKKKTRVVVSWSGFDMFLVILGIVSGAFFMSLFGVVVFFVWYKKLNIYKYL